jgi:hypothetical protein
VTDQRPASASLPPDQVAALVQSALRARKNGNLPAARALLRVLAAEQPYVPQVWLALATVAETRAEQRRALERVAELDPANPLVQRGLARLGAAPPPAPPTNGTPTAQAGPKTAPLATPSTGQNIADARAAELVEMPPSVTPDPGLGMAPALTPIAAGPEAARAIRWPLYVVIAIAVLAVLAATVLIRAPAGDQAAAPTPALPGAVLAPTAAAQPAATAEPLPTEAAAAPVPTNVPPTAAPPTATPRPTSAPTATPQPTLAIGQVVKQGQWHAVLLRPEDAVSLDGSIGTFQPQGRFVLALIAIGNDGPAPARIPADLFALIDSAGHRYAPLPAISTAYLNTYGRGQHGDLSMEDLVPADGGNKSVPLLFDVPTTARNLYLIVKGQGSGWAVRQ